MVERRGAVGVSGVVGGPVGVLVMAYGGPDSINDLEPYLLDVRGGRPVGAEMLEEMRERYEIIGGRSPILQRTEAQAKRLQETLAASSDGAAFRCYVGMRHWTPRIGAALSRMSQDGISQAVGLVMAPHYSRLSVGAYFKKVADENSTIDVVPIERWHLLPEFLESIAERVASTLQEFPPDVREDVQIIFTAHSLPEQILEWDDPYPQELRETTEGVMELLRQPKLAVTNQYEFAYQSAAMTNDPWLGPDAGEVIRRLHDEGRRGALLVPVGFTSDHVEILYDIDVEYARLADGLGFALKRIEMLNDDPRTMAGIAGLVKTQAEERGWIVST